MLARLGVAYDIEVFSLSIIQRRILKVRIGFVPGARLEVSPNVRIFENAAVFAKDDTPHELQIVERKRADLGRSDAATGKVESLPVFYASVLVLCKGYRKSGKQDQQ